MDDKQVLEVLIELPIREEKKIFWEVRDDVVKDDTVIELPIREEQISVLMEKEETEIQGAQSVLVKIVE